MAIFILRKTFFSSHWKTSNYCKTIFTAFTFLFASLFCPLFGSVIFVDGDATGTNNGQSWINAYTDLQMALTNANSGDDIWVANGTYYPTTGTERQLSFELASGIKLYGGFNGTESFLIQRDFEINISRLSGDIGVTGTTSDNSYHVVKGNNTDQTALVDGFTISHGYANGTFAADKKGGGIIIDGGDAVVRNCILENNHSVIGHGGGMFLSKSIGIPFTLSNCQFLNNTGRGLTVEQGTFTIHDCVFSNNSNYGLRVEAQANLSLIENSTFDNQASGGIWLVDDTLSVKDCSFFGNGGVGAIYLEKGQLKLLEGCEFNGNNYGFRTGSTGSALAVISCEFVNNTATPLDVNTYIGTLDSCTFRENSRGGFRFTNGNAIVKNTTFIKNTLSGASGGAIYSLDTLSLINCTLDSNTVITAGYAGGAIYLAGGNLKQMLNCTFTGNSTTQSGGAVRAEMNNSLVQNCIFTGNQVTSSGGGGINLIGENTVIKNCKFESNTISGGTSDLAGAGLRITGDSTHIKQCIFIKNAITDFNFSSNRFGGGVGIISGVGTQIEQCAFIGNSVASNSSGITSGGGIGFVNTTSDIFISNCIFSGNSVNTNSSSGGGACHVQNASISSCTFSNNNGRVAKAGLSIFGTVANTNVKNCIFKNNSSSSMLGDVSYTIIDWDYTGSGTNIFNVNPKFVDIDGADDEVGTIDDDLRLQPTSPAIDAGTAGTIVDLSDFPRDTLPDIGAYEFPTTNTLPPVSCPNVLNFSTTITPALCNTCATGAIDLMVTGGLYPYTYSWSTGDTLEDLTNLLPGIYSVTVIDADGCATSSSFSVSTTGSNPQSSVSLPDSIFACLQDTFQVCISVDSIINSSGFEFDLFYDSLEVYPTGNATVSSNYTGSPSVLASIFGLEERIRVVVILLDAINLSGSGELICIEFIKQPTATGLATFILPFIGVSYPSQGGNPTYVELPGGTKTTALLQGAPTFESQLVHWFNNSPIPYDAVHPDSFAITNIYGSSDNCTTLNTPTQPDLMGNFVHQMIDGNSLEIERDIPNTANVVSIISAQDAFLTADANVNNILPVSVFEAIAMDADQNGRITAGDATLILRRSVGNEVEFPRADGTNSRDWLFIDSTRALSHPEYINYSLTDVPIIENCLPLNTVGVGLCPLVQPENYFIGIPIGDVDGSWENIPPDGILRISNAELITSNNSKSIIFDLENTIWEPMDLPDFDYRIKIPITINSDEKINSMDIQLAFNSKVMAFVEVENLYDEGNNPIIFDSHIGQLMGDPIDQVLNLGAFRISEGMPTGTTSFFLSFYINCNLFEFKEDVQVHLSQLNGLPVEGVLTEGNCMVSGLSRPFSSAIKVYPNPGPGQYSAILVSAKCLEIELKDILGKTMYRSTLKNTTEGQIEQLNFTDLANGIYWLKIKTDNQYGVVKLIKQ